MGYLRIVGGLPVVVQSGESIFEDEYVREYEAKVEKASYTERGPCDDQVVIYNSAQKNLVCWTVPLKISPFRLEEQVILILSA